MTELDAVRLPDPDDPESIALGEAMGGAMGYPTIDTAIGGRSVAHYRAHVRVRLQEHGYDVARLADSRPSDGPRVTHGRHCPCSACAREDWSNPALAHCGMHGPACPGVYAPLMTLGDIRAALERLPLFDRGNGPDEGDPDRYTVSLARVLELIA
jgi:hypothetical protein